MSAQPVTMQWAGGRTELDDRAAVSLLLDGAAEPVRLALSPDPGLAPVLIEDGVADATRAAAAELLADHELYPGLEV